MSVRENGGCDWLLECRNWPDIVWPIEKVGKFANAVWMILGIRVANATRFAVCCIMQLQVIK
jgi:hypothetical protein